MSDNDNQDTTPEATDETVEFSNIDEVTENKEASTDPAPDAAETTEDTPGDQPEVPAETPEATPDKETPAEQSTDPNLKAMSRAERAEYFKAQAKNETTEVSRALDNAYSPQPKDALKEHYSNQGYNDYEAEMMARDDIREQERQLGNQKNEIVQLNANLKVDALEAQAQYDWMNPARTDVYDKDLHDLTADLFAQGAVIDPNTGQIIEARKTPMEVAAIVDKIRNSGTAKAQLKAQKAAEQQMASVAPPTSSAPPASSESEDDKRAARFAKAFG